MNNNSKFFFTFSLLFILFTFFTVSGCNMDHRSSNDPASSTNKRDSELSKIDYLISSDIDYGKELRNDNNDSNIFIVSGDKREYSNYKFTKTGTASSAYQADNYGTNSAIVARDGAELIIWDSLIITSGDHSHAVFSFGDGTSSTLSDCVVSTQGPNSSGIVSLREASSRLRHITVETKGANSPALLAKSSASLSARRGYYSALGSNSPAVLAAGNVSIADARLYSALYHPVVVEGNGSLALTSCDVDAENSHAVLLRASGIDETAAELATLVITDGNIDCNSSAVFSAANINAEISLSNVTILNSVSDGAILKTENSNVIINTSNQHFSGGINADDSSSVILNITDGSIFEGAFSNQTADISVNLSDSSWVLTDDSYISSLSCGSNDIVLDGHTLFVDGTAYSEGTAVIAKPQIPALSFDSSVHTTGFVNGVSYRAFNDIVYVAKPTNQEYQKLSIYIPEPYFSKGTVNGYSAKTAPIFMPNNSSGYMAARISAPSSSNPEGLALARGYVVVSPALRGRSVTGGSAPASAVDYKAAVRYLRANKSRLPAGNTDKIIVCGTSSGGALSAIVGASGNSSDYSSWLKEIGAADASDEVFASVSYCPVTNLDNADKAYEWVFGGEIYGTSSTELISAFAEYVNSLHLMKNGKEILIYDDEGGQTFRDYIESLYVNAAQKAIDAGTSVNVSWINVSGDKAVSADIELYAESFRLRQKNVPAFDKFDLSSAENSEFGYRHFTIYSLNHSTAGGGMADSAVIKAMNPMNYIGQSDNAKFWRIRQGINDRDITLNIPAILALALENNGLKVNFSAVWGQGHSGYYDTSDLFTWIDKICK